MVATSATRDAANRADFTEMVQLTLGQYPEVISGDEEAELSFAGAVGELDPATGPFLVVDIGGGSTELVIGIRGSGRNRHHRRRSAWTSAACGSPNGSCDRIRRPPPERDEATRWTRSMLLGGLDRLPVEKVRAAGAGVRHGDHGGRGRAEAARATTRPGSTCPGSAPTRCARWPPS